MKSISDVVREMTALINQKERQVETLLNEIEDLKKAIDGLKKYETSSPAAGSSSRAKPRITDAVFTILKGTGGPMHVTEIQKELLKVGLMPSKDTISGVLRKDTRKRFLPLPGNKFALKDEQEISKD